MNDLSRTPLTLIFRQARQTASKGDLSVNLCERYVFGGVFECGPMQYNGRCAPVFYSVYVSSSTIYDKAICARLPLRLGLGNWLAAQGYTLTMILSP